MLYVYPATKIQHYSAATADVVLLENHASPRFAVEVCRPDGFFRLCVTDDKKTAEAVLLRASQLF